MKRTATTFSFTPLTPGVNGRETGDRRRKRMVSPSESVIRNLLNYSKALAVLKTTETGIVNLVMN